MEKKLMLAKHENSKGLRNPECYEIISEVKDLKEAEKIVDEREKGNGFNMPSYVVFEVEEGKVTGLYAGSFKITYEGYRSWFQPFIGRERISGRMIEIYDNLFN